MNKIRFLLFFLISSTKIFSADSQGFELNIIDLDDSGIPFFKHEGEDLVSLRILNSSNRCLFATGIPLKDLFDGQNLKCPFKGKGIRYQFRENFKERLNELHSQYLKKLKEKDTVSNNINQFPFPLFIIGMDTRENEIFFEGDDRSIKIKLCIQGIFRESKEIYFSISYEQLFEDGNFSIQRVKKLLPKIECEMAFAVDFEYYVQEAYKRFLEKYNIQHAQQTLPSPSNTQQGCSCVIL